MVQNASEGSITSDSHSSPIQHRPRNYQKFPGAQYILPSDEEEKARLELQHRVLQRAISSRLIIPPLSLQSGDKVLDCGTGSGIWLTDLSKQVPSDVSLFGIDIEPRLFPTSELANMQFSVGTTTQLPTDWSNTFRLVNQRLLIAALSANEWPTVLSEIKRVLIPGGWVQLLEAKRWGTEKGELSVKHRKLLEELFASRNLLIDCSVQLPHLLKEAGFENVHVEEYKLPAGSWAGKDGEETRDNFINVFRGMKTPILNAGGFGYVDSEEGYEEWMKDMSKEWDVMEDTTVDICVFYAQKSA
ncbi:S-adenosyl-L-methionine-dependent methyltransferase [Neolentinus lepideus HHB14362 ss-1]|uniref:S-adenosyl-L-methionine-dependent methyltransferase n=1 Tax=Neolentinus lepideus HHB14362 ss-1 TaxID=1314782 RepID=A0A165MII4_9AGAM|nr:S-adenosyl-L-methionine-dependent methyltransferase [Neolentinus lepideus HHB14362 ss-1]